MNHKRRNFLKHTGFAALGFAGGISNLFAAKNDNTDISGSRLLNAATNGYKSQRFNMCGYAAPGLEIVRIGFIGLGNRGPAHLSQVSKIEGVEIKALCDLRPEKVNAA